MWDKPQHLSVQYRQELKVVWNGIFLWRRSGVRNFVDLSKSADFVMSMIFGPSQNGVRLELHAYDWLSLSLVNMSMTQHG